MKNLVFLSIIIFLLGACQSEEIDTTTNTPVFIPSEGELVEGTVRGKVVDVNGNGIEEATITFNDILTESDVDGNFVLEGQLDETGTFLKVTKPGFFSGSRKFTASENAVDFVDIQLVQRNLSGTIRATDGGPIAIDGSMVELPSGTYTTENGQSYQGEVQVYAHYMDPTERATFDQMPGDLTGFSSDGEIQGLITYGMMTVELQDADGEALKLPEGEMATLMMPVPDLNGTAPSIIPLWHFDEDKGIWIEEGEAQLINGEYIGEVSHFTTWNCDIPFDFVCVSGILNFNNNPAANFTLQFTSTTTGLSGYAITNSRGLFTLKVPKDQDLTFTVSVGCGNVAQDIPVGPFSVDQDLGAISLDDTLEEFTVIGSVEACGGGAVTSGAANVTIDGITTVISLEADGSFEHTFSNCSGADVEVSGVDRGNNLISESVQVTASGFQDVGVLEACDINSTGLITFSYSGQDWGLNNGNLTDTLLFGNFDDIVIFNQGGPNSIIRNVTILDWQTARVASGTFTFVEGETEAFYEIDIPQGFQISGTCDIQVDPFFFATDTSTDIEITDPNTYPGNIDEVFFSITIE